MRIALMGQQAFAVAVLKKLKESGENVIAAYTPPDKSGDPVKEVAGEFGIPVFRPARMRDPQVIADFAKLEVDLTVMAFVTDIVPEAILNKPRLGTIEYHPSILPRHRGGSAINWAVIQGDTSTGLSIFWPDGGLDTGPILLQKFVDIAPDDTAGSIYFNKLFPLGVEALAEAVDLVKKGIAPKLPQDEAKATYEGLCTDKDAMIDWALPASRVYNLIRGCNPRPGATTSFQGKPLKIFDSSLASGNAGKAGGQVVEVSEGSFTIAAADGAIRVARVQYGSGAKTTAPEFIKLVGLKPGMRFGA